MKFLVIRFRQMGDAVLATALLNTIKANFPDSEIDFVLNERLAPLFEGHPSIDRIVTFSDGERHSFPTYIKKIWRLMRRGKYDVVIDMRSTVNTLPFTLFATSAKWRIGLKKPYTAGIFNYRMPVCSSGKSMVDHNISLLEPLESLVPGGQLRREGFSLKISRREMDEYRRYLADCGFDFDKPSLLLGVVSKLAYKTWPLERMQEIVKRLVVSYPGLQLVFNYAPGEEERQAHLIYKDIGEPANVLINVKAASMRQLVALASITDGYFGNEGGGRHIVQAAGKPSLSIASPGIDASIWVPQNDVVVTRTISPNEFYSPEEESMLSHYQKYEAIPIDVVWKKLQIFLEETMNLRPVK